jgi:hypothetical protein
MHFRERGTYFSQEGHALPVRQVPSSRTGSTPSRRTTTTDYRIAYSPGGSVPIRLVHIKAASQGVYRVERHVKICIFRNKYMYFF